MRVIGLEGMTNDQIEAELQQGGKFVIYSYCISIVIMTFRRSSDIYFIRSNESAMIKGLGFSLLTFFLGWWGIP